MSGFGYRFRLGLNETRDAALGNGKKYGLSEWSTQIVDHNTGDLRAATHPAKFITEVYKWLYDNRANICWDAYMTVSSGQLWSTDRQAYTYVYGGQTYNPSTVFKNCWNNNSIDPRLA